MPNLISLEEHNAIMQEQYRDPLLNEPQRNGISCPRCQAELYDWSPNTILNSLPPKKTVRCKKCGMVGTRLA